MKGKEEEKMVEAWEPLKRRSFATAVVQAQAHCFKRIYDPRRGTCEPIDDSTSSWNWIYEQKRTEKKYTIKTCYNSSRKVHFNAQALRVYFIPL